MIDRGHALPLVALARRIFFKLADAVAQLKRGKGSAILSPIAIEAVKRIDAIFDVERTITGKVAD